MKSERAGDGKRLTEESTHIVWYFVDPKTFVFSNNENIKIPGEGIPHEPKETVVMKHKGH